MITVLETLEIHQCAWCRCLMVDGLKVRECEELLDMSHGICLECMEQLEDCELKEMKL